ncbi:UDP-N-acetylmuramoyl-tripeptide--D-alanyl-D-alanine ligase [Spirulina subsalsa FACHB-351]|uniref:UDP-N-acetylmuramoyl-tripeptide--D-alanyl-D-alanine ligase n=1 Tax=Spirulina subsalsa FACHB-351 TaxID=234711 RepID=A0ABT3LA07_9CYAN|nr:UDP-N-acetylmuramoyl-tripeptide--D-alanyl-D-alanine ligase [Spirulina subsalsa]MCW6038336.1 UDP-N-acetylmuramoyl-tripeptide--D-alanyl-D-alanine ligase [Spirulina subsalsa FACHB-351]
MTPELSLHQLADLLGITCTASDNILSQKINNVVTDSRTLKAGDLFVALRGERFDGHDFLATAEQAGARAAVIAEGVTWTGEMPVLPVADTLTAYQRIGRWWREQFTLPVIGLTGSVGKTTTKELLAAVLGTRGRVLKTEKNYNNEIGVPKTLLGLTNDHDYAVVEMAMRGRGQIAELTEIARPTIGLITNVGTAHIGLLGSEQAIAEAKCELLATMPKTSIAVLNADNERLMKTAAQVWQGETVTYGLTGGDVRGTLGEGQVLEVEGMRLPLPLPGEHNASNFLAALAVAKVLGVDWTPLQEGLVVELPGGRAKRYDLPGGVTVLDETYNAGYESMIAALRLLKETPGARHIAVLGTMKELGPQSAALHRRVGEMVQGLKLDYLLVLVDDPEAEAIAQAAPQIPQQCYTTHAELLSALKNLLQPGDTVLFKASNSVGLSQVVQLIIEN